MRYAVHYLAAMVWGVATPLTMLFATENFLSMMTANNTEVRGHATPIEYLLPFVLTGLVALGIFLVWNMFSVRRFLPAAAPKTRHFFGALLLYLLTAVFGLPGLTAVENLFGI